MKYFTNKKIISTLLFFVTTLSLYSQKLNVATFNLPVHSNKDIGNRWEDRQGAVKNLIRFYDFDIFGIQESLKSQLEEIKHDLPQYDYIGIDRNNGNEKGEYCAIIFKKERFTLIENGTFWLAESDINKPHKGWDAEFPRICTWGVFKDKKNGKKFIFMNTHFDHVGVIARKESAKLILQKAKELGKNLPLILTGDFNIDQHNDAYFTLANSQIVLDAYDLAEIKYEPNSTFNGWGKSIKESGRIDHIFLSKPFGVYKYGILTDTYMGKFLSDHFPVFVQVEW